MRPVLVVGGAVLAILSIPLYYLAPSLLSNSVHSFVASMSSGNTASSASMLRQMGYPPLHVVIAAIQYMLIGMVWGGFGLVAFGLIAKPKPKKVAVKIISEEQLEGANSNQLRSSQKTRIAQTGTANDQVSYDVVNNVLGKLESQLKDIKTGYESHKQTIEDEKKKLEQKERERMAKIIAAGEVLIKEITPSKFEEQVKYYIGLKNDDTGEPIDLSLLAQKFEKMKKMFDSRGTSDLTSSEFDSFRKFLE